MWRIAGILFAMAHGALFSYQENAAIHALLINDHSSSGIEESSISDTQRMQNFLEKSASRLNIPCSVSIVGRNWSTPQYCQKWIRSLPKSSQNIVVFYYSGEAAKTTVSKRSWPQIAFSSRSKKASSRISVATVTKWIQKQKPRLAIVLFDCYNELSMIKCVRPASYSYSHITFENTSLLTSLFLHTKGIFSAASAPAGKPARAFLSLKEGGGTFTSALLSVMQSKTSQNASWTDIARAVTAKCHRYGYKHTPIFKLTNHS
jgi:hypothetical protein